jgi:photosystem II stability/assembly factor-like uncharacterized protein
MCVYPNKRTYAAGAVAFLIASAASAQQAPKFDSATISGLPARNIGSAMMSGRIAAVDAIDDNGKVTIFAGSASGGVWKSVNGGTTFKPVFDNEPVQSIGAIAIDRSNPKIVWAGTGESWVRNSVSIGDGIYRSIDSGENWTNLGLKESERIAKILIDPANGNVVYACATGHLWDDSNERGVYKTTDGGKTWRKVLAGANGSTGCAMLAMSPQAPQILFASMWDFRRQAWTFRSGGPGSGLFKSVDGGEHWTEIVPTKANSLPDKPYGRIVVAVAPSNPQVVYAMVESAKSALFRSSDSGRTWTRLDDSQFMIWRPFYFGNIIVDPKDENKVFKVNGPLVLSTNGGKSFSFVGSGHGDYHDVWIDPANPNFVVTGDDGGLWRSLDAGTRWEHMLTLPVSQFYHVSVDDADPYRVYGGLQDNSCWVADSSYPGGVSNARWDNLYGGDGFWAWEDPADANYVYVEAQGGSLGRVHRFTHESRSIAPYAAYGEKKLRFNWNTPVQMSPNEKGTIYIGAQYLFLSRNHGQSWDRISPDLTTNDPEKQKQEESGGVTIDNSVAEMNTTIYSISESSRNRQVIWVGTDDGNIQVTRDGAKTWTNVIGYVPGEGKAPWVSWVEAGRYSEAVAYVTLDRHMYGDMRPYVYKTADFGRTWTQLPVEASGVRGYAHVIKEDLVNPNLLFLGTEFGLYISIDGGQRWAQYKGSSFPAVAVRDLVVHPRTRDLVLATHGRGIWIIDDIGPLRALTPDVISREVTLIEGAPAIQYMDTYAGWGEGNNSFRGENRPGDAVIVYYQRSRHIFGDLKLEILDEQGNVIDSIAGSKRRGLNRATWSMRVSKPPAVPPAATAAGPATGPRVIPGKYMVKMTKGDRVYTMPLTVAMDPRAPYTIEDRKAQFALAQKLGQSLNHMSWVVAAILKVRDESTARAAKLGAGDVLTPRLTKLASVVDDIRKKIVATKEGGMITGEERLREFLAGLYGDVDNYDGAPTDSQVARAAALDHELADVVAEFQALAARELPGINEQLVAKKLDAIQILSEADWRKSH